ncbi:hypothetical protein C8R43DRAFT_1185177 [Mycena crocata]|nr:hypothetical protein C8R43DRAFT_1185177 [Mycena crocata]
MTTKTTTAVGKNALYEVLLSTARQFKDGLLNLRIKNYSGLNMVDRRGRALIRQVFPHIDNLSAIGRAYGIAHNPIKSIVYNELDPEDDLSEDNGLVGPDFLHHFPPAPCPPKGRRVSRHVGRPTKKKSTSSANGKGKEMAVASKRRTPMANSDEESSAEADNRSNSGRSHCSREIDDIAPWDSREAPLDNAERQQTSPTPSPLVHNSPRHGGVASPQQQTFPTPSPPVHNPPRHGGAASPQDAPVHNVYTSHADIESQALPRFSPKGRAIPPTLEAFLENVGNFNLTGWSGKLVDLGFHSMYELQRVAKLDEEHRVRTLEMLLLPAQMTQLLIVSLATTLGDMPMHNVYESGGSGSAPRADVESQALPRFSPKGRVIPPAMEAFLENVGNFNLTGWSGELVDLGFHSMYEVRRVAKLDDEHRVRTLEMLLLPAQMTQLLIVSLAMKFADVGAHVWRMAKKKRRAEDSVCGVGREKGHAPRIQCAAEKRNCAGHREISVWRRARRRVHTENSCVAYGEKKNDAPRIQARRRVHTENSCVAYGEKKTTRRALNNQCVAYGEKKRRAEDSCVAYDDKRLHTENSCVAYGEKKNDAPRIHVWRMTIKRLHTENSCVAYGEKKTTRRGLSVWRRAKKGDALRIHVWRMAKKKATRRGFSVWRRAKKGDALRIHVWRMAKKKRRAEDSVCGVGREKGHTLRNQSVAKGKMGA